MWTVISDERLKEVVSTFNLGSDEIRQLAPKIFRYNGLGGTEADGKEYAGLIAQEVPEKLVPFCRKREFVRLNSDDEELTEIFMLDLSCLPLLCVNAIKDQQHELGQLRKAVDSQADRLMGPQPIGMQRHDVPVAAPASFQPTGLGTGETHAGQVLFELRVDFFGGATDQLRCLYRNDYLKNHPPPVLSSLPLDAWAVVVKEMEEWQHLSGFYNCPAVEKACILSGCCCCTMCPCWFAFGGYCTAPSDLMIRATVISRELAPHGLFVEGDDRITKGKFLVFKALSGSSSIA